MPLIGAPLQTILNNLGTVWSYAWWLIIPAILAPLFWNRWLWYVQNDYRQKMEWTLLHVRVPRDVLKTPKAMEQVFAAAHATYSFGVKKYKAWWEGEIEKWTSFEIMADADGPRFYIRVVAETQQAIESAIYAQYPDAEIEIADDYTEKFPSVLPNDTYDLHGADFILSADNALPIRTYEYFESKEEEEKIDTISTLMEALSHHEGDETTWIQFLIRPIGRATSDWVKEAQKFRDTLLKGEDKKPGFWKHTGSFLRNSIMVFFIKGSEKKSIEESLEWPEKKKEEPKKFMELPPGDKTKMEAIDKKMEKLAFETVIRWVYIDHKERLDIARVRGITAWARQFTDENLNSVRPFIPTYTVLARQPFKKAKIWFKKRRIYTNYLIRWFPEKFSIMNTEELATMCHFPSATVKAPGLSRIEAKKGTPPSSLPIR